MPTRMNPRTLRAALAALPLLFAASTAPAGLWDDVKRAVSDANDTVQDVKNTRDEAQGTVDSATGIVKDTSDGVEDALPERQERPAPRPVPSASPPPPPPPSASPPPPPSARKWHVDTGGGQTREVTETELARMIRSGSVDAKTPVYAASLGEWTDASDVPALKRYFSK